MLRKLFRAGNSLAVGVPRDMAGALGLGEGDYVEIDCDSEAPGSYAARVDRFVRNRRSMSRTTAASSLLSPAPDRVIFAIRA